MAEIVGSVSKNSSYYKYYIDVSETNIDTANNTSVVTATLKIYTNYSGTLAVRYASATHTITIDGTDYTITTGEYTLGSYKTVTLGSASKTVTHNTDGSKTVSVSANSSDLAQGNGWGPYSGSASGTMTLTNIPRASSVTCADGNIGSSTTININRASSNFTHTIKYSFGTLSGTITTKTSDTSIGWTIPTSFYAQIPNSTNGKGTIICETYNGDTLIGTKTCTFNAFVINSNPSITATVEDVNEKTIALTGDSNKLVKYFSNAKIVITATAKNSATISSQKVVCGDGKSSTVSTATIEAVESGKFTVSCVDSRGLTASETIQQELVEYIKLALTEVSLTRESTTSNIVNAVIKGNYYNNSFGTIANTLELKWRYRLSGGTWSEYTTITPTIESNTFSHSASLGEEYDYQNEYEFEVVATDKLMTDTITRTVTQGIPIIDIGKEDVNVNGETKATQFTGNSFNGLLNNTFIGGRNYLLNSKRTVTMSKPSSNYSQYTWNSTHSLGGKTTSVAHTYTLSFRFVPASSGYSPCTAVVVGKKDGDNWSFRLSGGNSSWNIENCGDYYIYSQTFTIAGNGSYYLQTFVKFLIESSSSNVGGTISYLKLEEGANKTDWIPNDLEFLPTTLYSNSSGTTGTVTLSETSANFSYLEIYYFSDLNNDYGMRKIEGPNGKKLTVEWNEFPTDSTASGAWTFGTRLSISGTSISVYNTTYGILNLSTGEFVKQNRTKIYKVVGYR